MCTFSKLIKDSVRPKCHAVHGAMGCNQKSFKLVWQFHQLLSGLLAEVTCPKCHVSQLIIRVIMRWYRGLCTDLMAFTLQLRKTSVRRLLMKAVRSVISSNGVPYLQMRSVGLHSTLGSEKEGKFFFYFLKNYYTLQQLADMSQVDVAPFSLIYLFFLCLLLHRYRKKNTKTH